MNKKNLLTFVIVLILINLLFGLFKGGDESDKLMKAGDFGLATTKNEYGLYDQVAVKIKNNTQTPITIKNECPNEPFDILKNQGGTWIQIGAVSSIKCNNSTDTIVDAGKETTISYSLWNHQLFNELTRYRIKANLTKSDGSIASVESNEFTIKPQGTFSWLWSTFFYQPIYNALIAIISVVPAHDLGLAIILLTILIRTILLVPSQNALKSQRRLQEIQPKLNKLREKHKDNKELLAAETMKLWKEYKVNPFGSCLPLLIQFPVLIALYYVIQGGLNPDNTYLLYSFINNFDLNKINIIFLGILDLTKINSFILPLIVGAMQFIQMKLAIQKKENKQPQKNKDSEKEKTAKSETEMANEMMIYIMPVMIAIFTASTPAGVGLYWSITTIYSIIQQIFVNKHVSSEQATVRVIEKK